MPDSARGPEPASAGLSETPLEIRRPPTETRPATVAAGKETRSGGVGSVAAWDSQAGQAAIACCRSKRHEVQGPILLEEPPGERCRLRFPDGYRGLSRCTTFTRYPAWRRFLPTSSAIMTERCWPPVQPKAIVR